MGINNRFISILNNTRIYIYIYTYIQCPSIQYSNNIGFLWSVCVCVCVCVHVCVLEVFCFVFVCEHFLGKMFSFMFVMCVHACMFGRCWFCTVFFCVWFCVLKRVCVCVCVYVCMWLLHDFVYVFHLSFAWAFCFFDVATWGVASLPTWRRRPSRWSSRKLRVRTCGRAPWRVACSSSGRANTPRWRRTGPK